MNKAHQRGLFITFEGGEGVGKSTILTKLNDYLTQEGFQVIQTREPGGCELGINIRKLLLEMESLSNKAELLLFLANRAQHVEEVIAPALKKNQIVLCDRFTDSTIAYQGVARHLDMNEVEKLCEFSTDGLKPDVTFLLDLSPEEGFDRVHKSRDGKDRIERESLQFHEEVRKGFLKRADKEPERIHIIDASQDIDTVFSSLLTIVLQKIENVHATS